MIQYLFLKSALIPVTNGTSSVCTSPSFSAARTRSFVPKKVHKNAATATKPNTTNVFVHAAALFPKYSTSGSVKVLMVSVPAVARRLRKILKTDLS